jgi:hypothetical protein
VCVNSTGPHGTLRVVYRPTKKKMRMRAGRADDSTSTLRAPDDVQDVVGGADELDDVPIQWDIVNLLDLLEVFGHRKERRKCGEGEGELDTCFPDSADTRLPLGADTIVSTTKEGAVFPVHRVVLAARSSG